MRHESVLIYDGDCPYCSVAATALRRLDGVGAVAWADDAAQALLAAQFDEIPFAMFLVDRGRGRVYAGRTAAEELTDRAGAPAVLGSLVRERYEELAGAVGRLSGRERDPDGYHAIYPLSAAARGRFDELAAAAAATAPEA